MESWESLLRCPVTRAPLNRVGDSLVTGDGRAYPVSDGVPCLLDEEQVAELDRVFQEQYQADTAARYDRFIFLQSLAGGMWEPAERRRLAALLDPPRGGRVLEVSVGTGANLPYLARQVGPQGEIVALDLSDAMLGVARRRPVPVPVRFVRGDGCRLPFADDCFDAVFHFGGINTFGDVRAGIAEMIRVAKPGAPVLISDEGMSESRRHTFLGRTLGKMNSLNLIRPPFRHMPWEEVEDFQLHWVWRELFYVFRFRKAAGASQVTAGGIRDELRRRMSG